MDLFDAMRTAFACREFTDEPVTDEQLHRILDTARFAPSSSQERHWAVGKPEAFQGPVWDGDGDGVAT